MILETLYDHVSVLAGAVLLCYALHQLIFVPLLASPLRKIPGPKTFAITKWRLAYEDWQGRRTRTIHDLHARYGAAVRVGPNEVSFSSPTALKTIYGAGSEFERSAFYRMFDVYGRQNMFTFGASKPHGERKKLLNHAYSKSYIMCTTEHVDAVVDTTKAFLRLVEDNNGPCTSPRPVDVFTALHYFSLDNISRFLYGPAHATRALTTPADRALLADVLDEARRKLSWFSVHLPAYTRFLLARTGFQEEVVSGLGLLPQRKPTVYSGIRRYALETARRCLAEEKREDTHIVHRLINSKCKIPGLDDVAIASECADHLLAGIDTTSDTLTFAIHALSLPANAVHQQRLRAELASVPKRDNVVQPAEADRLAFLRAVIRETLRLYAPLPSTEPRVLPRRDVVVDGYRVPAGTVVGMQPYTSHRNPEVFKDPSTWNPERWLGNRDGIRDMDRWWWAFGRGGRMCIGIQYEPDAMAKSTCYGPMLCAQANTRGQHRKPRHGGDDDTAGRGL